MTSNYRVRAVAGTAALLMAATGSTAEAKPGTKARIAAQFDDWNTALATMDPETVADRYARNAVLLPTLSNQVRDTRAEIVDYFTHFLAKHPTGQIVESHVDVLSQNSAVDAGIYRFTFADHSTVDARYTFVYERIDGRWLIVNHHSSLLPEH